MIKKTINLALLSIIIISTQLKGEEDIMTAEFITLGNCYICKLRIEDALKDCTGIHIINWDYQTDQTSVTYDRSTRDLTYIMQNIADVGHDTEWLEAPESAYKTLIGSCCEYERTINYDSVQIGYLSLMGTWEYALSIGEEKNEELFTVFYTSANNLLYISTENDYPEELILNLYSIDGKQVYQSKLHNNDNSVDLSELQRGNYIVILSAENKIIYRNKIVKL